MTHDINLSWKKNEAGEVIKMNLEMVQAWVEAHSSNSDGLSANSQLQVHFKDEESRNEAKEAIEAYWEGLDESSDEALDYKSSDDMRAEAAAAASAASASAKAKLKALGLSDAEVAAILGQ